MLRRDAQANRVRLLDAAERVFAEHGTDASMEEIARTADIAPATLYRRFGTKQALVREVLATFFGRLVDLADQALAEPPDRCLDRCVELVGYELAARRGFMHGMWGELAPRELVAELEHRIARLLARAQAGGGIDPHVTVGDIAALVWALRGIIQTSEHVAPGAWRRHAAYALAGFRAGTPQDTNPLTPEQVARSVAS
ncbi:helix-turn-helix domain-containing protein [Micromonospora sp. NPDC049559]|uniref:TetR/AcrR family transcriptional regulator n=1 Tax=Micromonospora sp. NPDC049559 TaxID=3155923 RepID=UPI003436BA72